MLKISVIESSDAAVTLRLEGRIIGCWLEELRQSCDRILAEGRRLTLDLAGVWFLDREAGTLLRNLKEGAVGFTNCSHLVAEQLKNPP